MRRLPALASLIVIALLAVPVHAASAAPVLVLEDPITDNYKASYNADPSIPERRTWLALRSVTVSGTTWRTSPPGAITITGGGALQLVAGDGRRATLTATVTSGPMVSPLLQRSDPTSAPSRGRWGPLGTITSRDALRSAHAQIALSLTAADGSLLGTGVISYRYDAALAAVPSGHIEYNGPAGRWYVGSTATRTQEESAPANPPSIVAAVSVAPGTAARPRIARVQMPVRTSRRVVRMRVTGRSAGGVRITHVRTRIGARGWGRWIAVRPQYALVLARGRHTTAVRIQLRDARGRTSAVVQRRVRCTCG